MQLEVFACSQSAIKLRTMACVSDTGAQRARRTGRIDPSNPGRAGSRAQQARDESQQRRLAGTIRAEQHDRLAGRHRQRRLAQRKAITETLRALGECDDGRFHGLEGRRCAWEDTTTARMWCPRAEQRHLLGGHDKPGFVRSPQSQRIDRPRTPHPRGCGVLPGS